MTVFVNSLIKILYIYKGSDSAPTRRFAAIQEPTKGINLTVINHRRSLFIVPLTNVCICSINIQPCQHKSFQILCTTVLVTRFILYSAYLQRSHTLVCIIYTCAFAKISIWTPAFTTLGSVCCTMLILNITFTG